MNKFAVTLKPMPGEQVAGAKLYLFRATVSFGNYAQIVGNIARPRMPS